MKVSGFTICRNVVRLGYPYEASIRSLLPLVDELIVGVGDSDDGTWEAVAAIGDRRLKLFRSTWNPAGGAQVLSEETNHALARCRGDWAVYLQADEVLHEHDLDRVRDAMARHLTRRTEGLLFRYFHFHGDLEHVADDWSRFYPRAVRVVKTGRGVESAGDACGFIVRRGHATRGLLKADAGARIFHYGWCNASGLQIARVENLGALFGEPPSVSRKALHTAKAARLASFAGTHPAAIETSLVPGDHSGQAGRSPLRTPAWLRTAGAVLRAPRANGRLARWLVPLALTNMWWRGVDRWRGSRRR